VPGHADNIELLRCCRRRCYSSSRRRRRLDHVGDDDRRTPASAPADFITDAGRAYAPSRHSAARRLVVLAVTLILRSVDAAAAHFAVFVRPRQLTDFFIVRSDDMHPTDDYKLRSPAYR